MPAGEPQHVLIVEDDPVIQLLVRELLTGSGYDVATADDGQEGLDAITERVPDLVVLDVMMPRVDGYEVLARLRADPATVGIPVVLLTALNSDEDVARGFAAGANDYVRKPFEPDDLLASVTALLGEPPRG